ncbi:MAG: hypothetical protein KatS3mg068_0678 [Candidatus Sericytochromatia bacterium]|nr:MAG: hypothetical protein KatS3mg068_0678 [Candidatus Sericytochromatia bacterium]
MIWLGKVNRIIEEFENVEIDKLVYNLNALSDISNQITSDSSIEISLANLLRILMGTLGATKGSIMLYAPFKLAFESSVNKGFDGNLYFRTNPKEVQQISEYKESFFVSDLEKKFPDFIKRNKLMFDKSEATLWVTLSVRNKLVGALLIGPKLGREEYKKTDLILLSIIANQISVAIANFQLIDELKKTNDKLRKQNFELVDANYGISEMRQITLELSSIMDVNNLLETFLNKSIQYLSCSKGILLKLDNEILKVSSLSKINHIKKDTSFQITECNPIFAEIIESGEIKRGEVNDFFGIDAKHYICVPLKSEREVLGFICLFDKESRVDKENRSNVSTAFSERDEAMISSLANHVATLWQKAKFYEMATIDGLTQLYVRRFLEQRMSEEIRKAQRLQRKLSLILIDIDHFKKFNDTWGHKTGDDVLRITAKTIKENVRKGIDIPARYGGEELVVLLPETDSNGAMVLAERIRKAIENTPLENPNGGDPLKITVSLGVSTYPDLANSLAELYEKADIALYKSKANGRNRATLYQLDN